MSTLFLDRDPIASIALASAATIRSRVYARFAWGPQQLRGLGYELATVRQRGYEVRLDEYGQQIGIKTPGLRDTGILDGLTQDSRRIAFDVLRTYNRDLRAYIASLPTDLTQAQMSRLVSTWQGKRAEWKTLQVAKTELMQGRSLAESDVMSRNGFVVLQRAAPESAQCPVCKAIVARGWLRPDQIDFHLPAHPSCAHSLEASSNIKSQAANKPRVWLGDWQRVVK